MKPLNHTELWALTQIWIRSHKILIWCIAAKYYKKMSIYCDHTDINQEASLVAFQTLQDLVGQNLNLQEMEKRFTSRFHRRCRELSTGVNTCPASHYLESCFSDLKDNSKTLPEPSARLIKEAFCALTKKQREVALCILSAPCPVSTLSIASMFNVTPRAVRSMIVNIVTRLEREKVGYKADYEYRKLRQTIPQTVS